MLDEPIRILIAALVCWLNFTTVDLIFKLPQSGGVCGATAIAQEVKKGGGKLNGGYMMGNIVFSPDASAFLQAVEYTAQVCPVGFLPHCSCILETQSGKFFPQ
jgi:energy-converting hydrogenase Eha subunit B